MLLIRRESSSKKVVNHNDLANNSDTTANRCSLGVVMHINFIFSSFLSFRLNISPHFQMFRMLVNLVVSKTPFTL